jgi:hypothetical protein
MSTTTVSRPRRAWWQFAGYLARRAMVMELRGYQSIYRFLFRRPRVPAGAAGFSYHQPIISILIVILVVSVIEMVVVDVIVSRWTYVRVTLLALSIWGLVYMLGLLFGMLVRPHAVGPDGIRVRYGSEVDIPLGWDDIRSVTRRKNIIQERQPKVTVNANGQATLHMRIQNETNIEVELKQAMPLRLPHGTETVSRVHLYADDSAAFLNEVQRYS